MTTILSKGRRAVGLAAALASACASHPPVATPPAPRAWVAPEAGGTPPDAQWWRAFGSARLDALVSQADGQNDDLRAALARVRQSESLARVARAGLLPTVQASGSVTHARAPQPGIGLVTGTDYLAELEGSYNIDVWGRARATYHAALDSAAASRFDQAAVRLTTLTSVASTYFQALALHERLQIAQQNAATAAKILDGLTLEQQVGTATALDVAQQASIVASLNALIAPLDQQWRQSLDALALLVGQTPEQLVADDAPLAALSVPDVSAGMPSELLARRPDVAEAEAQLAAAHADVAAARAALLPSITLTGAGGFESAALSTLLRPQSRIWSLGAGLLQPIFEGGALRGQLQYARARDEELLADYHKAVISAFASVDDALIAVRDTREQLDREQAAVERSREAFRFAQAQMGAGTINVLVLLNTQATLFAAEDALAQARYARLQAIVGLIKALGGGWQRSAHDTRA